MITSMTGFGKEREFIAPWGRISLEIRSLNHRFLVIVLHLPEGLLHLEQSLKEEIAKKIKRGHIVCRMEVNNLHFKTPVLNKNLIKKYYFLLRQASKELKIKQDLDINILAGLPGIWSVQSKESLSIDWTTIRPLAQKALKMLIKKRQQEGRAISEDIQLGIQRSEKLLKIVKIRIKTVIQRKLNFYKTDEEKSSFLRTADINEEIVRLSFHLKNFNRCLKNNKPIGKELDFILQEMQREANTIGAKSIDASISNRVIGIKSEIEKMREQVQNVE